MKKSSRKIIIIESLDDFALSISHVDTHKQHKNARARARMAKLEITRRIISLFCAHINFNNRNYSRFFFFSSFNKLFNMDSHVAIVFLHVISCYTTKPSNVMHKRKYGTGVPVDILDTRTILCRSHWHSQYSERTNEQTNGGVHRHKYISTDAKQSSQQNRQTKPVLRWLLNDIN